MSLAENAAPRKPKPKNKLDIVSRHSVSSDGTWLKRDIQSIISNLTPPKDDFLEVVFTSKPSMTNNRGDIVHHRYQVPHSTLKEGSKVKSDPTKRFWAHDFL